MKKYTVHCAGYYGYDVVVEAENEEEAREIGEAEFEEADPNTFMFIPDCVYVEEN